MAQIRVGGDPESYMDAPALGGGGGESGGGNFFANVLSLLGIHKEVGTPKRPEEQAPTQNEKGGKTGGNNPAPKSGGKEAAGSQKLSNVVDPLSSLMTAFDAEFGAKSQPMSMLTPIDPDIAALLPRTKL